MSLPEPRPGLVIRYAFLWSHEAKGGAEEASKDRPCAIVVAVRRGPTGPDVVVAPITHSAPTDPAASLPIPPQTCRALGLDGDAHWLRMDELNRFEWPGFDLRPLPGKPDRWDYGMLPRELFEELRRGILALQKSRRIRPIPRD